MSYDGVIDPDSAAALAGTALGEVLAALARAALSAKAADASAEAAEGSRAAIAALLASLGLPVRWSGTALQIRLPDGSYTPAVDLRGAEGPVGPAPSLVVGRVTLGDPAVARQPASPDAAPVLDFVLPRPHDGWSPVLALAADGARRVLQVVDWTGGLKNKPAAGVFVGPAGFVSAAVGAVDLRGPPGVSGASFIGASASAAAVALGPVTVVLADQLAFAPAQYQALISSADARNAMTGQLQAYDPATGTLTLNVIETAGSGSHADWIVTAAVPPVLSGFVDDGFYDAPNPAASVVIGTAGGPAAGSSTADDGLF